MAGTWQTVRVFLSSTFRDMHAERDHLVKVTFPALRERLEKYRVYLVDIDLRWGVTREQAENDKVLDLCLHEIDSCRPFFLGILGERYGWVPTHFPVNALEHYGWIQHCTGKSVTELEIIHGVLNNPRMREHAFFFFRDPAATAAVPEPVRSHVFVDTDPEHLANLTDLKERIRRSDYPVMETYPARWDQTAYDRPSKSHGRLVDLKEFGERVYERLWEAIKAKHGLPDQPLADVESNPLAEEADFHERFIESRLRVYVGRESIHQSLLAFAEGDATIPCLVTGPSGSGKSAILGKLVADYRPGHPGDFVLPHFVGAGPRSTALRDMLRRFCLELKQRFGFGMEIPEPADQLVTTFRGFLYGIPEDQRLLLVIDALNQLDEADQAHELYWLPEELPANVKVVCSCITEADGTTPVLESLRRRKDFIVQVTPLTDPERHEIIHRVPSLSAKTLDADQVRLLLANPASANPLFLLVALEELRGFGSFEQLNERIKSFPQTGDTVTAIFTQVLERLEEEFDATLVRTVLSLLASARHGLFRSDQDRCPPVGMNRR